MFTLSEKIALGISAIEVGFISIGLLAFKKNLDNQYLDKYGMTAKEYMKVIEESRSIDDYNKRIKREES